jgi:hypothetical protein
MNRQTVSLLSIQTRTLLRVVVTIFLMVSILGILPAYNEVSAASPSPTPRVSASPKATATPKTSAKPTATPKVSPSPSPSPDEKATENLKDRIDRILEQRQEKLKELEQAGQRRRVFIGEVQRITERTVTIRNRTGNQSFTVSSEVVLVKNSKAATIDDIAVGDWLGIIGFLDKETIQPQLVIISSTSLLPTKFETVIGTIKQLPRNQIVITDPNGSDRTFSIVRTTQFQGSDGNTIKLQSLQTETQVIIIAKPEGETMPAVLIKSLAGQR